jgi:hypothetical protein
MEQVRIQTSSVAAWIAIALLEFCPCKTESTTTISLQSSFRREIALARPVGPAPTMRTVVRSGRDIIDARCATQNIIFLNDFTCRAVIAFAVNSRDSSAGRATD